MPKKNTVKQIKKSKNNRVISGLIGGVGEYLKIDPVILRIIYVLVTAFTGGIPGVVAYVVLMFVVPDEN